MLSCFLGIYHYLVTSVVVVVVLFFVVVVLFFVVVVVVVCCFYYYFELYLVAFALFSKRFSVLWKKCATTCHLRLLQR